jgi:hypothetical protein
MTAAERPIPSYAPNQVIELRLDLHVYVHGAGLAPGNEASSGREPLDPPPRRVSGGRPAEDGRPTSGDLRRARLWTPAQSIDGPFIPMKVAARLIGRHRTRIVHAMEHGRMLYGFRGPGRELLFSAWLFEDGGTGPLIREVPAVVALLNYKPPAELAAWFRDHTMQNGRSPKDALLSGAAENRKIVIREARLTAVRDGMVDAHRDDSSRQQ